MTHFQIQESAGMYGFDPSDPLDPLILQVAPLKKNSRLVRKISKLVAQVGHLAEPSSYRGRGQGRQLPFESLSGVIWIAPDAKQGRKGRLRPHDPPLAIRPSVP
jgi:hypothetical protein